MQIRKSWLAAAVSVAAACAGAVHAEQTFEQAAAQGAAALRPQMNSVKQCAAQSKADVLSLQQEEASADEAGVVAEGADAAWGGGDHRGRHPGGGGRHPGPG